jgi:hypothetical protein
MSDKQGEEFRLLAPDEPAARAAFEQAHPDLVFAREQLLASLNPPTDLFGQDDGEDEGEPDEDVELTEDDVPGGSERVTTVLGPVSTALEADLRTWARRHGIVVWLDVDGHYSSFVDKLTELAVPLSGSRVPWQPSRADARARAACSG